MDTKRLIIGMLVAMGIVLGWNVLMVRMGWMPPAGEQHKTQQVTVEEPAKPATGTPQVTTTAEVKPTTETGKLRVLTQVPAAQAVELGSTRANDPTWSLGVKTLAQGAAISEVTLNQYPKDVKGKERYSFQHTLPAGGLPAMATASVQINGQTIDLSNVNWQLLESTGTGVARYEVQIGDAKPVLSIIKTLQVYPIDEGKTADGKDAPKRGGYEVLVRHTLQNLSGQPLKVELMFTGPTPPPREVDRGPDLYLIAGYNDDSKSKYPQIKPVAWTLDSLKGEKQHLAITTTEKEWPVIWGGMTSTYFDGLVLPVAKENHQTAEFIQSVRVVSFNPETPANMSAELQFRTKVLELPADGKALDLDVKAFFGPKARSVVKDDYYAAYPRNYAVTLTTTSSCSFCTIPWLVDVMVYCLQAFWWIFRDWGLAIIGLVFLVRLILHPLTRKSTISMHKMQKLAPELERLKKKYADNPQELQRATMQFYKEHGASQVLGCLPMFIQMPIWVALWSSLQSTFELRHSPFFYGLTWIHDLAKPDRLFYFPEHPINLVLFSVDSINVLPLLMAVVFFMQQHYAPKPVASTPEQEQQQKMMKWMTLLFPVMLYTGPAGLNLYIFTSTAIGMLESKMIRDHIKAREAAEAASGPVIIDAPATRASRRRRDDDRSEPQAPRRGIMGFFEKLQKMAEEAQKQQQQKKKK